MAMDLQPTPGARMLYLIRRRASATRDELVANWFANHMPAVIAAQTAQAQRGAIHATRYIATLFDPHPGGAMPWDGVAGLWFDRALPKADPPHGTTPVDTFQQKAAPYTDWATTEYVVMDGQLPLAPNTLNDPFPCTRSGFFKVCFLVKARDGADHAALFDHWLHVHVPNVSGVMREVGGFRYVVAHSINPEDEQYAGMAELYFADATGWDAYRAAIRADGLERWVDPDATVWFAARTEMVGIP